MSEFNDPWYNSRRRQSFRSTNLERQSVNQLSLEREKQRLWLLSAIVLISEEEKLRLWPLNAGLLTSERKWPRLKLLSASLLTTERKRPRLQLLNASLLTTERKRPRLELLNASVASSRKKKLMLRNSIGSSRDLFPVVYCKFLKHSSWLLKKGEITPVCGAMYRKTVIEFKAIKYSKAPDDSAPGQLVTKLPVCVLGVLAVSKFSVLIIYHGVLVRMTFDRYQLLGQSLPSWTNRPQIYRAQGMCSTAL